MLAGMTDPEQDRVAWQLLQADDDPAPSAELWPDPSTGPYLIELDWTIRGGYPEVVAFTVRTARRPTDNEALPLPLKAEAQHFIRGMTFRELAPGSRIESARQRAAAAAMTDASQDAPAESLLAFKRARAAPFAQPGRRGPAIDADEYAEVARIYLQAAQAGEPTARAVATHYRITEGAARKRIKRVRDRGLLPPAGPTPHRPDQEAQDGAT